MEAGAQPDEHSRREDVRAAVRDAMTGLLREKPLKDITIDEIARAAGLSRTAFYFYFKNKVEVLATALEQLNADFYAEAERWWSGEGAPEAQLREALEGIARVHDQHPEVLRVALEVAGYEPAFAQLYRQLTERFVTASAEHIRNEQAAGRTPHEIDPDRTAEALVWMTERCCWIFICQDRREISEVVDTLAEIWFRVLY